MSFGFPNETYKNVYKRIKYYACVNVMTHQLQSINSELCGLYCIYIAHFIFNNKYNHIPIVNDLEVFKFVKHMLWLFLNKHLYIKLLVRNFVNIRYIFSGQLLFWISETLLEAHHTINIYSEKQKIRERESWNLL